MKKRRKKTWAELHAAETKIAKRSMKEMKKKKHFSSWDDAFEYWLAKYDKYPKWLRNHFIVKGMLKSAYANGGWHPTKDILSKLARIDEKR